MGEKAPKRYYFPDEEPERSFIPWAHWLVAGLCGFCGQGGHAKDRCPNRPVSDYGR